MRNDLDRLRSRSFANSNGPATDFASRAGRKEHKDDSLDESDSDTEDYDDDDEDDLFGQYIITGYDSDEE